MDLDNFFDNDSHDQESNFDIRRYLVGILNRKWIILSVFLALFIPWLFYIMSQPPEYEAFTWVRFKNHDLEELRVLNQHRYIELTSRTFAEKIVGDLGLTLSLTEDDQEQGLLRQDVFDEFTTTKEPVSGNYKLTFSNPSFILYQTDQDFENVNEVVSGSLNEITENAFSANGFSFKVKNDYIQSNYEINFKVSGFRNTVQWFQNRVQIDLRQGGRLMQLRMVHHNPHIVAQMVNNLADVYVDESISFERKKAKESRLAIDQGLQLAKEQLDEANESLKIFKEKHFISLDTDIQNRVNELSGSETALRNLNSRTENLSDLLNKLNDIGRKTIEVGQDEKEIRYIYSQITQNKLFEGDASMGLIARQLADLEQERDKIIQSYPASHPSAVRLDEKIIGYQSQIHDLAQNQLMNSVQQMKTVENQINALEREISRLPSKQMQLAGLEKNVEVATNIYTDLRTKSLEFEITDAVGTEEVDIMDPAIVPEVPVNRGKKKNAAAGGVFAFFFAVGIAFLLEFLDKSIKSPEDIKKHLKLNVIGSIPRIDFESDYELKDADKLKQIDSQLVTYDYSPTPVGEAYRALRTKIVFSKQTGRLSSMVITSFAPGDGKSFTSSNLAVTLAQHKSNTLLIDADLRRGVLHNIFGLTKEPGLSNYLMGMVRFEDIVSETHVPNLSIVSCGSMMPNPSELLGSVQLKRLIEEASRRFDLILFDSPPLNAATDSVVIGSQTEGVILIIRAEVTNRNIAKQKLDLFDNVPANIIGVVLNGSESELAHDGYSYYHY